MLVYPRDAKRWKKFLNFEVITSSSQVGNRVFIVIKFLIQITSTHESRAAERKPRDAASVLFR